MGPNRGDEGLNLGSSVLAGYGKSEIDRRRAVGVVDERREESAIQEMPLQVAHVMLRCLGEGEDRCRVFWNLKSQVAEFPPKQRRVRV